MGSTLMFSMAMKTVPTEVDLNTSHQIIEEEKENNSQNNNASLLHKEQPITKEISASLSFNPDDSVAEPLNIQQE